MRVVPQAIKITLTAIFAIFALMLGSSPAQASAQVSQSQSVTFREQVQVQVVSYDSVDIVVQVRNADGSIQSQDHTYVDGYTDYRDMIGLAPGQSIEVYTAPHEVGLYWGERAIGVYMSTSGQFVAQDIRSGLLFEDNSTDMDTTTPVIYSR